MRRLTRSRVTRRSQRIIQKRRKLRSIRRIRVIRKIKNTRRNIISTVMIKIRTKK
jgi:hypothetical protein